MLNAAFLLLQQGLQLGQGDVIVGAHLATYQLPLPRTQARASSAAVWARREVAGRAREHLFGKAQADAEPHGDGGNRVSALFAGTDHTLA